MKIDKLNSFEYRCYVLIPDHKRTRTGRKSKKGILAGNDSKIISSNNVIFDEPNCGGHGERETISTRNQDRENNFDSNSGLEKGEEERSESEESYES